MKKEIHPELHEVVTKCQTCGHEHKMDSTVKSVSVDVCSNCHPFYTGNSQSVKSTGRVERFNRMFGDKKAKASTPAKPAEKTPAPKAE